MSFEGSIVVNCSYFPNEVPKVKGLYVNLKIYLKMSKNCDTKKNAVITLQFHHDGFTLEYYLQEMQEHIKITRPCHLHPLTPHFYIVKRGFTGVYIIFLFLL